MKKILLAVAMIFILTPLAFAGKGFIPIGGIFDITGGTGDVGATYAEGVRDYVMWINDHGGINGRAIKLSWVDYQYKIPQAIAAYKKFKVRNRVIAIQGWGTGDTEALAPIVARDKIPYMSASYSEHLTDPKKCPYNFIVGVTYSDQCRIALKWIKNNWQDKTRKPRVCFIYNDTGFGRSPFFPDGLEYAKKIGVDVVDQEVVSLRALDATSQLLNMKKFNPDYAIIQETIMATSTILRDAKKLGIKTKFIALNWAIDEKLVKIAGDAAEGLIGCIPFALWTDSDLPGIKLAKEVNAKYHPDIKYRTVRYIQGLAAMYVMAEALRRAGDNLTGEGVKNALESLRDFNTGGLTGPITFTKESHKGANSLRLYMVKGGKLVPITDYITIER